MEMTTVISSVLTIISCIITAIIFKTEMTITNYGQSCYECYLLFCNDYYYYHDSSPIHNC